MYVKWLPYSQLCTPSSRKLLYYSTMLVILEINRNNSWGFFPQKTDGVYLLEHVYLITMYLKLVICLLT